MVQSLRKDRAEAIQSSASDTRNALHMADGPEQEARDRRFGAKLGEAITNPDKWSDPSWQEYAWGTDVRQDALNYISTVQPFSLGNLPRPLATQPRPAIHFGQAPPGKHGPQLEFRCGPLISHTPLITDNEHFEQTLPQPVSSCYSHKRFSSQASTDSWSAHSIMENVPTLEKGTSPHGRQHTGHSFRVALGNKAS
jgi:hypothetical protein